MPTISKRRGGGRMVTAAHSEKHKKLRQKSLTSILNNNYNKQKKIEERKFKNRNGKRMYARERMFKVYQRRFESSRAPTRQKPTGGSFGRAAAPLRFAPRLPLPWKFFKFSHTLLKSVTSSSDEIMEGMKFFFVIK